jgi:dTDP-4-amino-4,6-dideoxygalactose transaminase
VGILSVFHYVPLHLSAMGEHFGARQGDCPVAESISDRLVRLPFFNDLHSAEQGQVIERLRQLKW